MIAGVAGLAAAASSVGMLIVTADGRVAWVNDALVDLVTGTRNPDSPFEARLAVAEAGLPLTGLHPAAPPAVLDWAGADGEPRRLRISCRDMSAGQPSELLLFEIVDLTGEAAEAAEAARAAEVTAAEAAAELTATEAALAVLAAGQRPAPADSGLAEDLPSTGPVGPAAAGQDTDAAGGLDPEDAAWLDAAASIALAAAGAETPSPARSDGGFPTAPAVDPLTGFATRYAMAEELDARIAAAAAAAAASATAGPAVEALEAEAAGPAGPPGCLLLLDVDHLADVNDLQGHTAGDAVLRGLAHSLRAELPEAVLGRLGGDEFAVLLPTGGGGEGLAVAERLCGTLAAGPVAAGELPAARATVSIGVVPLDLAAGSEAAFAWADLALRAAKRSGRNRARLFTREQYDEAALRVTVTSRVAAALDSGQMALDVLPLVDLASREVVGFELLSRLRDGVWPELGPRGFLAAAEHTDLGLHLDRWVVLRAVNALVSGVPGRLYVNLAARSLHDPAFGDFVLSTLRDGRVDPARLGLEISESAAVASPDAARRLAEQVGAAGCPVLLDDFGMQTGAIVALRNLPLWAVKIDANVVRNVDANPRDRSLVEAVVQIARTAGMLVIAEGVDRASLPQLLLDLGVGLAQGYHVGRPRRLTELLGGPDGDDVTTVMSLGNRR
ncbi:EAL domain-containing protein [Parafrankia discariae]|uniref:EAL domain-containing protein n=1 Tax=Parafrankia discariae TaxID=365528 RepID=UPI0003A92E6D|nr:EAL domain-containing protein [Parafrankia discariae]